MFNALEGKQQPMKACVLVRVMIAAPALQRALTEVL